MKTIKWKLILITTMMLVVVCTALGVLAAFISAHTLENQIQSTIESKAIDLARIVSISTEAELSVLEQIASSTRVSDPSNELGDRLSALENDLQKNGYLRLAFIDSKATAYYTDGTSKDLNDRAYVIQALSGISNVSDSIVSKVDGSIVFAFAVPVEFEDEIVGALVAIRPQEFLSKTIEDATIGGTSYGYLLSSTGTVLAHKDIELVKNQYNVLEEALKDPKAKALADIVKLAIDGKSGYGYYWFKGSDKMMGYAPIQGLNWSAMMTIPESEIMEPIVKMETSIIALTLALMILGITGATFFGSAISKHIVATTQIARIMASGDLTVKVPENLLKRKDEIGQMAVAQKLQLQNFHELIGAVIQQAQQVAASSEELTAVSDQVSLSSIEIARSVEEIAEGATDQAKDTENGAH